MLRVENLVCGYKNFYLQDINFSVEDGQFLGIIGPNASGKSTLLKAIAGLLRPKKGTIFLDNQNIYTLSRKELAKKIAIVLQNPKIIDLKVYEFILLARIPFFSRFQFWESKKDFEIAQETMKLVGVLEFKDRLLPKLSSGQMQLAFIAKALCQQPKILILDEPTTHLDMNHQITILNLLKKLNRDLSITVILTLHDLNLASQYCNHLILLNDGKIYKKGSPLEVLEKKTIEEVYKVEVFLGKHPLTNKPFIFFKTKD